MNNIIEPFLIKFKKYKDNRGTFYESYKKSLFLDLGFGEFVQDNHSISRKNVIRGLHYQWDSPMGKLVRVSKGKILDTIVDIRKKSLNYGKIYQYSLCAEDEQQLWVPPGFAHGFLSLEEDTHVQYKCTAEYNIKGEAGINPLDEKLEINWPVESPIVSDKDLLSKSFATYDLDPKFL